MHFCPCCKKQSIPVWRALLAPHVKCPACGQFVTPVRKPGSNALICLFSLAFPAYFTDRWRPASPQAADHLVPIMAVWALSVVIVMLAWLLTVEYEPA